MNFLSVFGLWVTVCGAVSLRASLWHSLKHQTVVSSWKTTAVTSSIMCVRHCSESFQCDVCAVSSDERKCFLQPEFCESKGGGINATVFLKTRLLCLVSEAPVNQSAVTWQSTLTSLVGNVKCDEDFMYSGDNSTFVRCSETGEWETEDFEMGECKQRIWRNKAVVERQYPIPRPVHTGWAVCLTVLPTKQHPSAGSTAFAINLKDDNDSWILHITSSFTTNITLVSANLERRGGHGWNVNEVRLGVDDFPFQLDRPSDVKVEVIGPTDLRVLVDNTFLANFTSDVTLDVVTKVQCTGNVNIVYLDVWCNNT